MASATKKRTSTSSPTIDIKRFFRNVDLVGSPTSSSVAGTRSPRLATRAHAARTPDRSAHGQDDGAVEDAHGREREGEEHAPCDAKTGERPRPAALVARQCPGGGVGDGVVGEYGEGAESDGAAQIGDENDGGDECSDGQFRSVRDAVGGVDGVEPAGQFAVGGH